MFYRIMIQLGVLTILMTAACASSAQTIHQDTNLPDGPRPDATVGADQVRASLTFAMSGYHHIPTREELDAIAEPAVITSLLRSMIADEEERPMIRLRAVDLLGFYGDDDASFDLLSKLLTTNESEVSAEQRRIHSSMRHRAINSLVRARPQASTSLIDTVLQGDDVQLTLTAIHALGKSSDPAARNLLKTFAARKDHDQLIRSELRKFVEP